MSFSIKRINVRFDLANGQFDGGGNSHVVSGLRVLAHIDYTGGPTQSKAVLAIFGLPLSVMNQLSTVGTQYLKQYKNGIAVEAGDDESGMTLVFSGVIGSAFVDGQDQPNVCFRVVASPLPFYSVKPAEPISIQGSADAAGLIKQIAGKMGLGFENAGVTAKLASPYFGGSLWTQALQIARHGAFDAIVDRGTMAIVAPEKTRAGGAVLISPKTGMVGYPGFVEANVLVAALFNPSVQPYGEIEIQSDLTAACGKWKVNRLEYELESQVPNGKWFMLIEGVQIGPTVS